MGRCSQLAKFGTAAFAATPEASPEGMTQWAGDRGRGIPLVMVVVSGNGATAADSDSYDAMYMLPRFENSAWLAQHQSLVRPELI